MAPVEQEQFGTPIAKTRKPDDRRGQQIQQVVDLSPLEDLQKALSSLKNSRNQFKTAAEILNKLATHVELTEVGHPAVSAPDLKTLIDHSELPTPKQITKFITWVNKHRKQQANQLFSYLEPLLFQVMMTAHTKELSALTLLEALQQDSIPKTIQHQAQYLWLAKVCNSKANKRQKEKVKTAVQELIEFSDSLRKLPVLLSREELSNIASTLKAAGLTESEAIYWCLQLIQATYVNDTQVLQLDAAICQFACDEMAKVDFATLDENITPFSNTFLMLLLMTLKDENSVRNFLGTIALNDALYSYMTVGDFLRLAQRFPDIVIDFFAGMKGILGAEDANQASQHYLRFSRNLLTQLYQVIVEQKDTNNFFLLFGKLRPQLRAAGISVLEELHEAWLVNTDEFVDFISTGSLTSSEALSVLDQIFEQDMIEEKYLIAALNVLLQRAAQDNQAQRDPSRFLTKLNESVSKIINTQQSRKLLERYLATLSGEDAQFFSRGMFEAIFEAYRSDPAAQTHVKAIVYCNSNIPSEKLFDASKKIQDCKAFIDMTASISDENLLKHLSNAISTILLTLNLENLSRSEWNAFTQFVEYYLNSTVMASNTITSLLNWLQSLSEQQVGDSNRYKELHHHLLITLLIKGNLDLFKTSMGDTEKSSTEQTSAIDDTATTESVYSILEQLSLEDLKEIFRRFDEIENEETQKILGQYFLEHFLNITNVIMEQPKTVRTFALIDLENANDETSLNTLLSTQPTKALSTKLLESLRTLESLEEAKTGQPQSEASIKKGFLARKVAVLQERWKKDSVSTTIMPTRLFENPYLEVLHQNVQLLITMMLTDPMRFHDFEQSDSTNPFAADIDSTVDPKTLLTKLSYEFLGYILDTLLSQSQNAELIRTVLAELANREGQTTNTLLEALLSHFDDVQIANLVSVYRDFPDMLSIILPRLPQGKERDKIAKQIMGVILKDASVMLDSPFAHQFIKLLDFDAIQRLLTMTEITEERRKAFIVQLDTQSKLSPNVRKYLFQWMGKHADSNEPKKQDVARQLLKITLRDLSKMTTGIDATVQSDVSVTTPDGKTQQYSYAALLVWAIQKLLDSSEENKELLLTAFMDTAVQSKDSHKKLFASIVEWLTNAPSSGLDFKHALTFCMVDAVAQSNKANPFFTNPEFLSFVLTEYYARKPIENAQRYAMFLRALESASRLDKRPNLVDQVICKISGGRDFGDIEDTMFQMRTLLWALYHPNQYRLNDEEMISGFRFIQNKKHAETLRFLLAGEGKKVIRILFDVYLLRSQPESLNNPHFLGMLIQNSVVSLKDLYDWCNEDNQLKDARIDFLMTGLTKTGAYKKLLARSDINRSLKLKIACTPNPHLLETDKRPVDAAIVSFALKKDDKKKLENDWKKELGKERSKRRDLKDKDLRSLQRNIRQRNSDELFYIARTRGERAAITAFLEQYYLPMLRGGDMAIAVGTRPLEIKAALFWTERTTRYLRQQQDTKYNDDVCNALRDIIRREHAVKYYVNKLFGKITFRKLRKALQAQPPMNDASFYKEEDLFGRRTLTNITNAEATLQSTLPSLSERSPVGTPFFDTEEESIEEQCHALEAATEDRIRDEFGPLIVEETPKAEPTTEKASENQPRHEIIRKAEENVAEVLEKLKKMREDEAGNASDTVIGQGHGHVLGQLGEQGEAIHSRGLSQETGHKHKKKDRPLFNFRTKSRRKRELDQGKNHEPNRKTPRR